eukprot:TRINITY_DN27249_c0_g1_i1.p1 TRINITY_DN27249_c0_g1~~TRINITY_DN27249_c0_g1_i1.p1  ORF type:complete len:516 (-),score=141.85 TRINITY_DN27249_c0_g1_i1:123-1670(-)
MATDTAPETQADDAASNVAAHTEAVEAAAAVVAGEAAEAAPEVAAAPPASVAFAGVAAAEDAGHQESERDRVDAGAAPEDGVEGAAVGTLASEATAERLEETSSEASPTSAQSSAVQLRKHVRDVVTQVQQMSAQLDEAIDADGLAVRAFGLGSSAGPGAELLRSFLANREAQLQRTMQLQAQFAQERRRRRQEQKRDVAPAANGRGDVSGAGKGGADEAAMSARGVDSVPEAEEARRAAVGNAAGHAAEMAGAATDAEAAGLEPPAAAVGRQVGRFKSYEEALQFVMRCQPFDFAPVLNGHAAFPRFEHKKDAFLHALTLQPPPTLFVGLPGGGEARRHLRIVKEDPVEAAAKEGKPRKSVTGRARRGSLGLGMYESAMAAREREKKQNQYVVESVGEMFERPASLRDLRDVNARYYIAVSSEVYARVLVEGFRVKRRTSIPCCATAQDAISHFKQAEARSGKSSTSHSHAMPCLLTVTLPPHIDVVPHKDGGFLIRAKELPPSVFRDRKRQEP